MHKSLTLAACLISASTSLAQFTSPNGLDTKEGNNSFFASTNRRYMGIDATNMGTVAVIKSFAMRRDGTGSSTASASTVDVTLDLGETDMGAVYSEMDRNFSVKRTRVHPKKQVNWPPWPAATPAPAPFDLIVPLATPYLYLGQDALVWDLIMENGTNTSNRFDRDYTGATSGPRSILSAGCSGFTLTTVLQSNGANSPKYGMRMRSGVTKAPPNSPVQISLALNDADATVPGFCAKVHAIPLATLPLGMSDAAGKLDDVYFNFAFDASLNGVKLVNQAFSTANGALTLSSGQASTMPSVATNNGHEALYLWSPLTTVPNRGLVFHGGSIVVRFGT